MEIVTKQRAFQDSWNKWVKGSEPRAVEAQTQDGHGVCMYRARNNIGCAIGQYLLDVDMSRYEGNRFSLLPPRIKARFEDPHSPFWTWLQYGHDLSFDIALSWMYAEHPEYPEAEARRAEHFLLLAQQYKIDFER